MDVAILMFPSCAGLGALGPYEILGEANRFAPPGKPFFRPQLVSTTDDVMVKTQGGVSIQCQAKWSDIERPDLVVAPSLGPIDGDGAFVSALTEIMPWLSKCHQQGTDVASFCTGAFLLAETGLLDGLSATTHWGTAELFQLRYPQVELKSQRIIVDEGRVCSAAGATAFLHLMIYLIQKYRGLDVGHLVAKGLLIDVNKSPQTAYAILSTQKNHGDAEIRRAQDMMEEASARPLSIDKIAASVALSRRSFMRRFKASTGNTPREYVQRVRIEKAKAQLESTKEPVSVVAERVGYEDVASFRKIFVRLVGIRPREYRDKYQLSV